MRAMTKGVRKGSGEQGFTLVELLIVLAILAVLVAVVLPNFTGLLSGSKTTAAKAELNIVQTAVDAKMAATNITAYPTVSAATSNMSTFGLYPTYMRGSTTNGTYTVIGDGTVAQASPGP